MPAKVGTQFFSVSLQFANPQILGLIPQSQIRNILRYASRQIPNPQIFNCYSANMRGKKAVYLIQIVLAVCL
jgi:hypothetical protein